MESGSNSIGPFLYLLEMLQTVFVAYARALHDHPLPVKVATSTIFSISGDFFAQTLERIYRHQEDQEIDKEKESKPWKWNKRRTLSIAVFGIVWGFTAHFWYHYLDLWGFYAYPESVDKQIIFKLVIDMLIFEPFAVGLYFVGVGTLEGQKFEQICCKLSTSFFPIVAVDFLIWPVFTLFVFHKIPVNWQAITFASMDFFYDLFLSLVNHSDLFRKLKKYLNVPCRASPSSTSDVSKEEISLQPLVSHSKTCESPSSVTIEIRENLGS